MSLLKVNNKNIGEIISDESNKLKVNEGILSANLPKGFYILNFLALNKSVNIQVAKLVEWGSSKQLIDNDTKTICSLPANSQSPVSLSNDFTKTEDDNSYRISLKL